MKTILLRRAAPVIASVVIASLALADDLPSKAPNFGSVANTRHNLTMSYLGPAAGWMSLSRNDYGEVCVYCHTPHGTSPVSLPLWNRTIKATSYRTYDQLETTTLTQPVTQPGVNSLACLSCHDGQTAVDSIVNMPGSGRWNPAQASSQNNTFLDAWPGGPGESFWGGHGTLEVSQDAFGRYGECQSCHSIQGDQHDPATIPAFDAFYISTDLRNDHPVGVAFPTVFPNSDFRQPTGVRNGMRFFDGNGNGRADPGEIRLYNTGDGYEVECASCHDPHGVPSGAKGSPFIGSFLRVANTGSTVCLTCHTK